MNTPYDPRYFIRIPLRDVERLLCHRRDFWICNSKIAPVETENPMLVRMDSDQLLKEAAKRLTTATEKFVTPVNYPEIMGDDPIIWSSVVSSAFFYAQQSHYATCVSSAYRHSAGGTVRFGRHYYYEHPRDVALWNVSMAIDAARERAGFTEYPEDCPLVVLHYDAFQPPGLRMESLAILQTKLPHWNVRAPASLMMRATTPPVISVNTRGTGKRLVNQIAMKQSDFRFVCEFLGVPDYIYSREVPIRNTNKDYVNATRRTNSSPCDGELG